MLYLWTFFYVFLTLRLGLSFSDVLKVNQKKLAPSKEKPGPGFKRKISPQLDYPHKERLDWKDVTDKVSPFWRRCVSFFFGKRLCMIKTISRKKIGWFLLSEG